MTDQLAVSEALEAARLALVDALGNSEALAGVKVSDGYPFELLDECGWVSDGLEFTRTVEVSTLRRGAVKCTAGGGMSVSQFSGEDWTPMRTRLLELSKAAESTISPALGGDPTLGGSCFQAFLTGGRTVPSFDLVEGGAEKPRLSWFFEVTIDLYA